jgi:hypothetical protein
MRDAGSGGSEGQHPTPFRHLIAHVESAAMREMKIRFLF